MRCSDGSASGNSRRCGLCAEFQEQAEPWQIHNGFLDSMLRGYCGILATVAGLAALFVAFGMGVYQGALNNPHEQRYQPYRYNAEQPKGIEASAAADAKPQPLQYRTPCHQPEGQGESDLCAQWRAANAAQDGAFWTKWGVWIGIIGSTLLLWQIILTRQAVVDTSEATEAMREANEIARDTAKRQLRAYITTEDHCVADFQIGGKHKHICKVYNRGQTPAYDVKIWSRPFAEMTSHTDPSNAKVRQTELISQSCAVLGPGAFFVHENASTGGLAPDGYASVSVGGLAIIWAGVVTYRDAFGKRRRTTFKYHLVGEGKALPSFIDMSACSRGNVAD